MGATALRCPRCEHLILSQNRHDYRKCDCGACSVDGGLDYFRYSYAEGLVDPDKIEFIFYKLYAYFYPETDSLVPLLSNEPNQDRINAIYIGEFEYEG